MDVGSWLKSLGLGQYEAAFRDNEIDGDVLPKLTVDDLKDLGVAVVGHRRKIMSAIEALNAPSAAPAEAEHAPVAQTPAPVDAAERRQLTVMFSDLVGSTALSARLDPEDMRQVIRAYQDSVSGVVARYDGFVAKFMGDGVLAYFGFPRAHEDDAARAVHAGLEIAEAVAALQTRAREKLAVRIGIATGLVVVGDLVGQGSAQEQAVVGDTPNLAARLQGLADAGGVVVSASTRRLIGDRFRLRDLGKHAVKGLAEPVEAFAALGVSASESRFEAAHSARLAGFVGREAESADLLARQRHAWGGQGQIALISGDAGIGKSRLAAWLAEQVAETPHTRLRYQCSPYHRDSALYPFVQQLERAAGIAPQEPAEAKLDRLEKVLGLATDRMGEVAPLVASMLSIPTGARYPALNLSPVQQRRQTLSALLDQMEGLARKQPLLMLFEDAHWADATSLEVLDLAIERVRRLPVMMLVTSRPEFEAPWKGLPDVAEIALQRFDRAEAEALVERVTGGRKLPAEVLAQIVAKTDGVPLFVEELTKNVLESGLLVEEADRFRLDGPLPPLAIPSTLQDSLMARLDRLAAVKEIAQIGAAIGREFSYPLLNAVVGRDEPTLRAALAQLEESELVFRSGEPPAARYTFKHALVQDTAYESLLKSRRQILHQKIAETLREKFADVVEAEPELLAHHFTQAGLTAPAIEYWGKAGDLALRRSAFKEAIAHLGKAIEMTEAAGAGEQVSGQLKLQISYGRALMQGRGYGAHETAAALERARVLATGLKDSAERLSVTYGLWAGSYVRGELGAMRELAKSFLRDCANIPTSGEACVAHRINGVTEWAAGELVKAREHLEQALAIFDPERDRDLALRFGQDIGVPSMAYSAFVLWALGEIDLARERAEELATRTAQSGHAATTAYGLTHSAMFEILGHNLARAEPFASLLSKVANEHQMALWMSMSRSVDGWVEWRSGHKQAGLLEMRRSIAVQREQLTAGGFAPLNAGSLAEAEAETGEIDAAIVTINLAIADSERTGQRWFDAELHRIRGEILLKQNPADPTPAEEAFLTAIAIAQHQKARSFELRAALALAKLYRATGRHSEAHAVLGPALEGFAPTPEFPEIAEAQALFAALAETDTVKAASEARKRHISLQVSYGNAMFGARGFAAPETTAAFERARELAVMDADSAERFSINYGLWAGSYVRGELGAMRELSEAFLCDCASRPNSPEAGVAHRIHGVTKSFAGEFDDARAHLEKALAIFQNEQDDDLAFRFGMDIGIAAMIQAAMAYWPLGEFYLARRQADAMATRLRSVRHIATAAYGHTFATVFEIMRRDYNRAELSASALVNLSKDQEMPQWSAFAKFLEGWSESRTGGASAGILGMRNAIAFLQEQRIALFGPLFKSLLAEVEAETGQITAAIATINQALAESDRNGQRRYDAELHCTRGEILHKHNPGDPAPAEAAFLAAIAVAQAQKAPSFELRAALSLAKLYRATGRDADAHAALAPALQGFAPTPEFPEIAEANALFDALAQTDEVKADAARRQRLTHLHVARGNALIAVRGAAAPETTEAFTRARASAHGDEAAPERLAAHYGLWVGSSLRGELPSMRTHAAAFLAGVTGRPDSAEAGVAHRVQGMTHYFAGEFVDAVHELERALSLFQPGRDDDLAFRFGQDTGASAMVNLAVALWPLGPVDRAIWLIDRMRARIAALTHVGTLSFAIACAASIEVMRGDHKRAAPHIFEIARLAREHDLPMIRAFAVFLQGWAASCSSVPADGIRDMRRGVDLLREQNVVWFDGLLKIALAEAEARAGAPDRAIAILDEALATGDRLGYRTFEAELHRARGEIFLKRDATNAAPAEEAFQTSVAVARSQGARSFELRAALALAKLYRAAGRNAEAHGVLGPALEGFSPTPEFPEIEEALAFMATLHNGVHDASPLLPLREKVARSDG